MTGPFTIGVKEGQSGWIEFTLRDEAGVPVPRASLNSLTLDLYRLCDGVASSTINGRSAQSVLNENGGSMGVEDGVFRWTFEPADTPFLGSDRSRQQIETHIAHFRWTWDSGTKGYGVEVTMNVRNSRRFAVA